MAIVKGVNEIVHLPLYDSLFVRPGKTLGDLVSANVLKFFVNIHGKTKLETNMQSSALLPHWNTFEARALRVVISDLPETIVSHNGNGNGHRHDFPVDLRDFEFLFTAPAHGLKREQVVAARESLTVYRQAVDDAKTISKDFDECLGLLRRFCHQDHMGRILKLQGELRSIRKELATILTRTRVKVQKSEAINHFCEALEELEAKGEERYLAPKLDRAIECLNELSTLTDLGGRLKGQNLAGLDSCVAAAEKLVNAPATGADQPENLRQRFEVFVRKLAPYQAHRHGRQVLGKLLYNSVTTLFVGEKIMIQMPTWFFPAGAGPYAENGQIVTNGFPTPQATFNFAEPVVIDTQQHFRVELEIPEADAFQDFKSISGPFFIWVVLDGYMKRDVQ
jgi:hypothetical protein